MRIMKLLHPQKIKLPILQSSIFQPDFNMAVCSACAVLSILKGCFFGLLFEFVPTNQIDRQVYNICICKIGWAASCNVKIK